MYIHSTAIRLIERGWNIANRRLLTSKVGKVEVKRLIDAFERYNTPVFKQELLPKAMKGDHKVLFRIHNSFSMYQEEGDIFLKLGVEVTNTGHNTPYLKFKNTEINVENIKQHLKEFVDKVIKKSEAPLTPIGLKGLEKSATLEKMFTPAFKVPQELTKDGYYATSIIDKATGKVQKAYVKMIESAPKSNSTDIAENWGLYVKHSNGQYELIGNRKFTVSDANHALTSGWMDSYMGGGDYSGIGVRLHQIGVERALQKGFKKVQITAIDDAFPFHYKCGFRADSSVKEVITKAELDKFINEALASSHLSLEEIKESLVLESIGEDKFKISAKTFENIVKKVYAKTGKPDFDFDVPMALEGSSFDKWAKLAKSQPIFI